MWYYSKITEKIVPAAYEKGVDQVFGKGTFAKLRSYGIIAEAYGISVLDVLKDTGSMSHAAVRYRELHPACTSLADAREAVKRIRRDYELNQKGKKKAAREDISETPAVEMTEPVTTEETTVVED